GAMTLILLLAPALIWSNKHASRTAVGDAPVKLPPASTIGPELQPYTPTQLEADKLMRHTSLAPPPRHTRGLPKLNSRPRQPQYLGMTPAELEKLAECRRNSPTGPIGATREVPDEWSTIEDVPRIPGAGGLTPGERAKLEYYQENQTKKRSDNK
ncbi:MAG: hypothetical protein JSW50_00870, partial [Candidatus Latescibacterota bacterium]